MRLYFSRPRFLLGLHDMMIGLAKEVERDLSREVVTTQAVTVFSSPQREWTVYAVYTPLRREKAANPGRGL